MGNQSSRSLNKENSSHSHCNLKDSRGSKSKFLNPENLVLPVIPNGPQRLRNTDNGNILQSGGTISGRRNNHSSESSSDSEFKRFLQHKNQANASVLQNTSFCTLLGHKKSHSDPDIVRKMMEENETEEDDDGRYETESNPTHRSIIALSPSKAKIRSRKKKKAPEPPQSNTLPRALTNRNNGKIESNEINRSNSSFDSMETPRRPLPPIPLDEMPPPPPPPPPDYNRTTSVRDIVKSSGNIFPPPPPPDYNRTINDRSLKPPDHVFPPPPPPDYNRSANDRDVIKPPGNYFQKNRRTVDKWKFSKPNSENFVERRQRSKSLDRSENLRYPEKEPVASRERFDRNYSLRNVVHRQESALHQPESKKSHHKNALHEEIINAAKQRAERLARSRKLVRNLSFRSSMTQPYEDQTNDAKPGINCSIDLYQKEQDSYKIGNYRHSHNGHGQEQYIKRSHTESHINGLQKSFQNERSAFNSKITPNSLKNSHRETSFEEKRNSHSNENLERWLDNESFGKNYNDPNFTKQSYPSNQPKSNGYRNYKDRSNANLNHDEYKGVLYDDTNPGKVQEDFKETFKAYVKEHEAFEASCFNKKDERIRLNGVNSFGVTKQPNYSFYRPDAEIEKDDNGNIVSRNFSRVGAMHKRSYEKKKYTPSDYRTQNGETVRKNNQNNISRIDLGILPPLPVDNQTNYNSRSQESFIPFLPNGTVSSSSISEEEMEINLQLRPTLPRKPIDIPRFSPTDVWKSINLDFFKSHQQRSDVSSEEGENSMEEKIHRINRPVAPRRLIQDRSGDSGISPDAESPMFFNEQFDAPITANAISCSPNVEANEEANATWVPQHDLDESECGSDTSQHNKYQLTNEIMQPKFSMPNLMFPSRSLPRTDNKNEEPTKEKITNGRRKRGSKMETQHFNSLRNLKRVLGMKSKEPIVETNGLDPNWSLSRSLPSFQNVECSNDAKIPDEVPEVSVLDHVRRSNSESRVAQQENSRPHALHNSHSKNAEWRKSFPNQSSEGHIIYLPEYCSTTLPCQTNLKSQNSNGVMHGSNNKRTVGEKKASCESTEIEPKNKKKFSYQSTVRQLERKKLEEQLAKEVEEKERLREFERYVSDFIEDEYRKVRVKDKTDVSKRWRMHSLEVHNQSNLTNSTIDKYPSEVPMLPSNLQSSSYNTNERDIQESCFTPNTQGVLKIENSEDIPYIPREVSYPSKTIQDSSQICRAVPFISQDEVYAYEASQRSIQTSYHGPEIADGNLHKGNQSQTVRNNSQNAYNIHNIPKNIQKNECDERRGLNEKEVLLNQKAKNSNNEWKTMNRTGENMYEGDLKDTDILLRPKNAQRHYNGREKYSSQNKAKNNVSKNTHSSSDIRKTGSVNVSRAHHDNAISSDETCATKNKIRESNTSYNLQQPTGMKKWQRRPYRDHNCQENALRPEPEGGRSSSDDCKHTDGRRERINEIYGSKSHSNANHGKSYYSKNPTSPQRCHGVASNTFQTSPNPGKARSEDTRDGRPKVHPKMQINDENGTTENNSDSPVASPFMGESVEEYELHTRLCRTNSGRTFESHSYYAIERRKEDSSEYDTTRKNNPDGESQTNVFSSLNFEKELKENVQKKSRDSEKRSRKYPSCDYDSDDSGSDRKEDRYQRHNKRNQKKRSLGDHRETSFSRNHPHRNGARIKSPTNGHFTNGRNSSIPKSNHTSAQRISNSDDLDME